MKLQSKPISSPVRTDKFPPPLVMRLLRTNIGSKSLKATTTTKMTTTTRSRSSPMFLRRKTTNTSETATTTTTQEPSSPKVTCMGQVRVNKNHRSSKKPQTTKSKPTKNTDHFISCRCRWINVINPRALFCRPKISRPVLGKWVSFFRRKDSHNNNNNVKIENTDQYDDSEDSEEEEPKSVFMAESDSVVVPKNALILTRCRSAPYRSSSLASRFWESPLKNEEEEKESKNGVLEKNVNGERIEEKPISENGLENEKVESPKRIGDEDGDGKRREELGLGLGLAILTRCKSEPARIGERLYPEFYGAGTRRRRRTIGFF